MVEHKWIGFKWDTREPFLHQFYEVVDFCGYTKDHKEIYDVYCDGKNILMTELEIKEFALNQLLLHLNKILYDLDRTIPKSIKEIMERLKEEDRDE